MGEAITRSKYGVTLPVADNETSSYPSAASDNVISFNETDVFILLIKLLSNIITTAVIAAILATFMLRCLMISFFGINLSIFVTF
jgi:uncharacterized membrane protein